jgi:uncharacterized membrane protein
MSWHPHYNTTVYVLAAVAALAALWLARASAMSSSLRSVWLFAPRALVLGAIFFILLNPVRESARQLPPRRAQVACLVDSSQSMGLDRPTSRLEEARQVVYSAQTELMQGMDGPELQFYRFGSQFSFVPSLADLRADQVDSRLADALEKAIWLFEDEPPKAVVVISDGAFDAGEDAALEKLAEGYAKLGVPIHVLPVGSETIRGDIAISGLSVPRGAKPNDMVPIRVTVRNRGYEGTRLVLDVRPQIALDAQPVAELPVTLTGQSASYDLVVPADPKAGGLRLSIPVQKGEAIESNNSVPFELVAQDQKIRVFYMEGTSHIPDYRYVQEALQEDPNIECTSLQVDQQWAARPRLMRVDDPYRGFPATREELFAYDVVICSDISRGAFTPEQLDWTVELVKNRGGGFAMVGGHTSFGAGAWDQTAWDQLIPIDMRGGTLGEGFINEQFNVQVPEAAQNHPIWRIVEDPQRNRQILARMPHFYGTNIAQRVKPAATLLGTSVQSLSYVGQAPIFACQSYGRGRTFAMMTDTTYWWGDSFEKEWGEGDNRYFRKFWRNVVRWLSENSLSGQRRLLVETDKLIYRPGEPLEITAQAFDEEFRETTQYRIEAELLDARDYEEARVALTAAQPGKRYGGRLTAVVPQQDAEAEPSTLAKAILQVTAYDPHRQVAQQQVEVQILQDSKELLSPAARRAPLDRLAEVSGGKVLTSASGLAAALAGLPSEPGDRVVHRSPAWDRPWLWSCLLGFLSLEWILRRRYGFTL